ncbi:hypothetical protein K2P96_00475 [Patescibacteria group bacterium]|nr:hypothetical protein [Patescibacteria group bacterium]
MNFEKMDKILSDPRDIEQFNLEVTTQTQKAKEMLSKGEAYYIDEKDEKGNLKTIKIFDSKTGELIYFKDFTTKESSAK